MKEKNQKLLGKFKSDLQKVGGCLKGSDRNSISAAYKLFIEYAFEMVCDKWVTLNVNEDVADGAIFVRKKDIVHGYEQSGCDFVLGDALLSYFDLVADSEPFEDIFTMLHEEFLLMGLKGDGLGQFFAASDISYLIGELILTDDSAAKHEFSDDCCGAGSLKLGVMKGRYRENPDAFKTMNVEFTDIDELACKSAFIQVVASMIAHEIPINQVRVFNSNILSQWGKPGQLMVGLRSPDRVPVSSIKPGNLRAFEKVSALCKTSLERTREALTV
ncbi:hypothetical protein [Pseudomonas fluorescens]|uniref:hypothetical protein n=1 Tax=Pseudomonas fluorescens TaxID=294 RepID=UPI00058A658A|nr:hypothetical protein [Pseudomonas fluorescens]CEL31211.1 hypothetical protein SRM1_04575 [Pseudomonas fluorescens]